MAKVRLTLDKAEISDYSISFYNDIFENFTVETKIARTTVNSVIHNYIKANNLYKDENNHSVFKSDAKLKNLFDIEDKKHNNDRIIFTIKLILKRLDKIPLKELETY